MKRTRSLLIVMLLMLIAGCAGSGEETEQTSVDPTAAIGSPARGAQLILNYGCGGCHTIPGIAGANTHVGPTLTDLEARRYLAGSLINTPENLTRWIQDPKAIEPNTAMPDLGVSTQEAQDITAYLYAVTSDSQFAVSAP